MARPRMAALILLELRLKSGSHLWPPPSHLSWRRLRKNSGPHEQGRLRAGDGSLRTGGIFSSDLYQ